MKITAFNPQIITRNGEEIIRLFEALGFEKRHEITINSNGKDITTVRMKNEGGFYVDISQVDGLPQDMTLIRINVDDFDEAYEFLKARGFVNEQGDGVTDTGSSKATLMMSPSGYGIVLSQHLKK